MAQLIAAFNAMDFDPSQGSGSLPVGKHPVIISDSEVKANGKNDGGFLELTLRIIDGPQSGTTGAYRLNLYNASERAVEIAHRQMSALCHVTGVFQVTDSQALHGKPFIIEVGMQKGEEAIAKGYTEVKKVFDINGNEPGKAGQGAQAQQPAQGFQQPAQHQAQPQQQFQQQQPAQQQPAAAGWGQQAQQPAQGQPQQQFQQQPAQQPAQGGAPAWGQGAPAQQQQQPPAQQQPAQQQPAAGGWQQQQAQPAAGGQPAWGR